MSERKFVTLITTDRHQLLQGKSREKALLQFSTVLVFMTFSWCSWKRKLVIFHVFSMAIQHFLLKANFHIMIKCSSFYPWSKCRKPKKRTCFKDEIELKQTVSNIPKQGKKIHIFFASAMTELPQKCSFMLCSIITTHKSKVSSLACKAMANLKSAINYTPLLRCWH